MSTDAVVVTSSSTSRWVTSRAVRGPEHRDQHAVARAAAAPSAGRVQRGLASGRAARCWCAPGSASTHAERRQRLGQPAGPRVVVGQPVDVVRQRVLPGRGEDAGLAHAAAHPLADPPGLGDPLGAADTTSEPTGAPSPLDRQTDSVSKSRAVRRPAAPRRRRARARSGRRRSAARRPASSATARSARSVSQRDHRAAAAVVGLLDRDRPGRHGEVAVRPDHRRRPRPGRCRAPTGRPGAGGDAADARRPRRSRT